MNRQIQNNINTGKKRNSIENEDWNLLELVLIEFEYELF
jgi:hypothetical protein